MYAQWCGTNFKGEQPAIFLFRQSFFIQKNMFSGAFHFNFKNEVTQLKVELINTEFTFKLLLSVGNSTTTNVIVVIFVSL